MVRKSEVCSFILMVVTASAVFGNTPVKYLPKEIELSQCGINALYTSMRQLGVRVPLKSLYSAISPNDKNEVSLFQLADFARQQGLFAKGVKRPTVGMIKKMLSDTSTIIIQFEYGLKEIGNTHMATLIQHSDSQILFLDAPLKKVLLSEEQLEKLVGRSQGMMVLSVLPFPQDSLSADNISRGEWAALSAVFLAILVFAGASIKYSRAERSNTLPNESLDLWGNEQ